jgi:hypothetical protein
MFNLAATLASRPALSRIPGLISATSVGQW